MTDTVLAQLAALKDKTAADLKAMWQELFDKPPPVAGRAYLESRLSYRIQELAYGGLKPETVKRLDALATRGVDPGKRRIERPLAGTRLVREWGGVEHHVTVLTDGFEHQGRRFKSLSAVAKAITGTQWNGPAFFGLRSAKANR
jgi:hypothetical protein